MVTNATNYLVFENLDYIPHISLFSSLSYIVGDLNSISNLGNFPAFQTNDTLLTFSTQPNSVDVLNYASTVVFDDRTIQDLLMETIGERYTLPLVDYGRSENNLIGTSWVQASAEQNYLTAQGISTSGLLT